MFCCHFLSYRESKPQISQASISFTELPRNLNSSPPHQRQSFPFEYSPSFRAELFHFRNVIFISRNIRSQGLVLSLQLLPSEWIHQEVAKIMGIAVKELAEDGQFGLVYQSFLGFEIRNFHFSGNSLHFKNCWHWSKKNKYVSKTMEFELELVF